MSFFDLFTSPAEWRALGASFGLAPYQATAGYSRAASFRQLKRALGLPAASSAPTFYEWHFGRWNGVEALLLNYVVGSGKNRTTYTAVVARIDPPLFLGLGIHDKPILDLFGDPPFVTGYPALDQSLRIFAFDERRALEFLAPQTQAGADLLQRVIMNIDSLDIGDSTVTFTNRGRVAEHAVIRPQLDLACWFATTLAQRRATFPWTPAEEAQMAEWQRFATEKGLTFDRSRMMLYGVHQHMPIKIALETAGKQIGASVDVRFPQAVNVAFSVLRTQTPGFLQGLFDQDIQIGDPIFDEQYKVTGHPELVVLQMLANPVLLDALKRLGAVTTDVQLNSVGLYFRVSDPLTTTSALASVCETARVASTAFFGEIKAIGPYR